MTGLMVWLFKAATVARLWFALLGIRTAGLALFTACSSTSQPAAGLLHSGLERGSGKLHSHWSAPRPEGGVGSCLL